MDEQKIGNWYQLSSTPKLKAKDSYKKDILLKINSTIKDSYYPEKGKNFGSYQTKFIKRIISEVGLEKGFWVYANRMSEFQIKFDKKQKGKENKFKNREWLYDIHWYKDSLDEYYLPIDFTLAVECEWKNARETDISDKAFSAVKYDFQKLLVTNAKIRLLIFKAPSVNNDKFKDLNLYFENAIKKFPNLEQKSCFLFVCFAKRKIFYAEKYRT